MEYKSLIEFTAWVSDSISNETVKYPVPPPLA